ncbi:hypothetical protein [Soonwooa sp.]|uniref:hypothetical protein n=1 Tax=Soonwooa sp. TaxID=1938592 RepID=UPI0026395EF1|nr:hypothetical protein [Soonwooa sp.]
MKNIVETLKQHEQYNADSAIGASEIEELNENLGFQIPAFFVDYLEHFGFDENLFWTIFNDESDFIDQNEFIREMDEYQDYIVIGDEYGENLILAHLESSQLYLLEDDHLFDLKINFKQMLEEITDSLKPFDYNIYKEIDTAYQSLLSHKNEVSEVIKLAIENLKNEATENDDQLYSIIISKDENANYTVSCGSFNDFKIKTDSENINYNDLFNTKKSKYQGKLDFSFLKQESNLTNKKALDLLCLDVLRELKNDNYFEDQVENISISVESTDTDIFTEDSYDDALTKRKNLLTTIRRFWETPYDRTRLILENL